MNHNDAVAIVLSSGLSLIGLAYLYLWLYRDYRRDLLRTRLFEIRGELFDQAAAGKIGFDHPAYGLLRSTLNGFLRSGHRIGAWRIFLTAAFIDPERLLAEHDFQSRWQKAAKDLDPEVRAWLEGLRMRVHIAITKHLIATTTVVGYALALAWIYHWDAKLRNASCHQPKRTTEMPALREGASMAVAPPDSFTYRLDSVALANAA